MRDYRKRKREKEEKKGHKCFRNIFLHNRCVLNEGRPSGESGGEYKFLSKRSIITEQELFLAGETQENRFSPLKTSQKKNLKEKDMKEGGGSF